MAKDEETNSSSSLPKYLKQDEESQESFKSFISTLPREKGWLSSYIHKYKGFWLMAMNIEATISCQQHFQPKKDDVFIVTYPKCGTTWLKALAFTLTKRNLHSPLSLHHPLLKQNPYELVPFLELDIYLGTKTPHDHYNDYLSSSSRMFSSHLPYLLLPESIHTASSSKIVYLCRNPKDTFVSLWIFINKLRQKEKEPIGLEDALDMFCKGVSDGGPFWDHVLGYWEKGLENPRKILFMKYEDMKEKPVDELKRLADFLGYPFSMEEEASGAIDDVIRLCNFDKLKNLEVNKNGNKVPLGIANKDFFRRGEVGDWKNYLSPEMADRIDSITEQKFNRTGLIL